jgi:hypothetical protein
LQSPCRYPTTPHQATSSSYKYDSSSAFAIIWKEEVKRCYKEMSDDDGTAKERCHRKSIAPSFLYSIESQAADLKQGENDMKGIAKFD